MSVRALLLAYANPDDGRALLGAALAELPKDERGRWLEVRPRGAKGEWRLAFFRDGPFDTFPKAKKWAADELRGRLESAAKARGVRSTVALIAFEDQAMTRALFGIAGTGDFERSVDARSHGERLYLDERGKPKREKKTFGARRDEKAEAPFCALHWLEEHAGVDFESFVAAAYDADGGVDVTANLPAPAPDPLPAFVRRGLRAKDIASRADALMMLQSEAPSPALTAALVAGLADGQSLVRSAAAFAARMVADSMRGRDDARQLADALLPLLDTPGTEAARDAASAIAALDHAPDEIVARGRSLLASDDPATQVVGALLLSAHPDTALDALERGLRESSKALKQACAEALAAADALPASIAPALVETTNARGIARDFALRALGAVRGAPDVILPPLEKALAGDEDACAAAIEALGRARDVPVERRRALLWPLLTGERASDAAEALADMGVAAEELLLAVEATKKKDERTRMRVLDVLHRLALHDAAAVAAVERRLDDPARKVSLGAVDRLAWAWKQQPAARAALERATKHASATVRELAKKHLASLAAS